MFPMPLPLPDPSRDRGARRLARPFGALLASAALLLCPALAGAGDDLTAQGWVLKRKSEDPREGYALYARPRAGSQYAEYRMEVALAAKPEEVMAALEHNLLDPATHPSGLERRVLRREEGAIVTHDIIRVPFLSDRDVVVRTEVARDPKTGNLTMRWREIPGEGPPPAPGMVRMPSSRGSWTLIPDAADGTLAVYDGHVELGGSLPAAFVEAQMPKEIAQQAVQLRRTMRERIVAQR